MKAYIACSALGVFAYDEGGALNAKVDFSRDPKAAAKQLAACFEKELSKAEKELVEKLRGAEIIFELEKEGFARQFPNPAGQALRGKKADVGLLREVNIELTRLRLKTSVAPETFIIQAIGALSELQETQNAAAMRLREWAGWWLPETAQKIKDLFELARAVMKSDGEELSPKISKEDITAIRAQADFVLSHGKIKSHLGGYIDKRTKEIASNISELVGAELAAKLIAAAGSLEDLARMPSSTIQVLGAEKALFRFMRGKGKAPKHGLILAHPAVIGVAAEKRGKAARLLAAKISMAAKADFFKGGAVGEKLKAQLEKEIARLR